MAQLLKIGNYLVEIDGTHLAFFDANGNQQGHPQDLSQQAEVTLPDGTPLPQDQLADLLAGDPDALASFKTAAGAPASTDLPTQETDSGGGRFAAFEEQQSIGGLHAIGGLQQTELENGDVPQDDGEKPEPLTQLTQLAALDIAPTADSEELRTPEDTVLSGSLVGHDTDGGKVTYILVDAPQHGTIEFHSDGTFTYTPAQDYNGPDHFTYKVNDGVSDSKVAGVSITVQPVNDLPIADDNSLTIAEDSVVNSAVTAHDVDGDSLTFSVVDGPQHGTLTFHVDGTFTYTPNADYHGADSFTYHANDGTANGNVATISIDVRPENDLPVSENGALTLAEDSIVNSSVHASDVDGDALTYSLVNAPQHGTIEFHADGTFTYTPNADYNGPDSFTFKANDGTGDGNVSKIDLTISPVNDVPVSEKGVLTIAEDSVVNSAVHATDVDHDTLTYSLVDQPQHGTIAFHSDGTFTYTPVGNYNGPDSFTFKANDGTVDSNVSKIDINVSPVNDLPVSENGVLTLAEDSVVQSSVHASDIDNDALTYALVDQPQHGTIDFHADGTFTYTPNGNYNGPDSFTFKANDGTGDSNVSAISLNVSPVNDVPVSENGKLTIGEDSVVQSAVHATDIDNDALSYSLVDQPQHGTISFHADGTFTYTPNGNYNGPDSFTFRANDGSADSNVSEIDISVLPVNDLPVSENGNLTLAEDSIVNSSVHAADIDNDALSYSLVDQPQHGTISFHADGTFTYTPNANYNGTDSFTFKANDGTGDSNVSTVSLNVSPVNDVPVSENGSLTLGEDSVAQSAVHATDVDNDALSYSLVGKPEHGTISFHADGTFTYTPNADYNGPDSFTFKANDGSADSNVSKVDINVLPVNDLPVSENSSLTLAEDSIVNSSVHATDIDNDALTYSLVGQPQHGTISFHTDGTFTYTPNGNYNGPDSFTFKANDGTGNSNISKISLNVSPVNDLPVAQDGKFSIAEDTVAKGSVTATDVDGDALSYSLAGQAAHGTVNFKSDGTFTYTPNADYNGSDSFTYLANDGHGNSNLATVNIQVQPVNDLPVAENGTLTLAEDSIAKSSVHASDVDGDAVSYAMVGGPAHGSITFNADGTFTYKPDANFNGTDTFTYKANDGHGDGNIATVTLKVTPVDDAPVVTTQGTSETAIHITRVSVDQNPFGDNKVGDYLAAGGTNSKAVNPSMINGVDPSNLTLSQAADVKVSFVSEGAGYKSMVGTYTYDAKGNIDPSSIKFLWLDATQLKENTAGGALAKDFLGNTQPQDVSLGNIAAGTKMGFFIIADGASQSANTKAIAALSGVDSKGDNSASDLAAINKHLSFTKDANGNGQILLDGKALTGNVYFTHDKTLNTDNVTNDIEHTLSGVTTKPDGKLYVGFEDLAGGGDKDYDDVIISVDIGSYNINKLSQTTTQPTVHLSDIDSTNLASATVTTSGFVAGDVLNMPSNALFNVTAQTHGNDVTYLITAKAGSATVAAFEDFLNHAFFSTSTVEEGHRTISYQVTDAEGVASNIGTSDVHVTASYEISASELNSLTHLGTGDDILHLNASMTKTLDLGLGHDTVHLAQTDMSFGSAQAQKLDNVEVIDARDAGNNKVAISIADVLDMTDGNHHLTILGQKGDSLTLTGDGSGHGWTATDHGTDFTTYTYNDGVHQAVVEVSNQMAQTVV